MKKVFLLLLLILIFNFQYTMASNKNFSDIYGVHFNTYRLNNLNQFAMERGSQGRNSGFGFFIQAKERITDDIDFFNSYFSWFTKNFTYGLKVEHMKLHYDDFDGGSEIKISNTGILFTMTYYLFYNINFNAAFGQYFVSLSDYKHGGITSSDFAYSPGAKIGLESHIPVIGDQLNINWRVNYRYAQAGDYDFSGLEFSILIEDLY